MRTVNEIKFANKCNQCDKISSLGADLRGHLRMHSGEKSNILGWTIQDLTRRKMRAVNDQKNTVFPDVTSKGSFKATTLLL